MCVYVYLCMFMYVRVCVCVSCVYTHLYYYNSLCSGFGYEYFGGGGRGRVDDHGEPQLEINYATTYLSNVGSRYGPMKSYGHGSHGQYHPYHR